MKLGALIDQMYAIAAGITVGTAPMIWSDVIPLGPLALRAAHLAGAITLILVLLPKSSAVIRSSAVTGLGSIGMLTLAGATLNAFAFNEAFWPTSELLRFVANLLIALAVVTALTSVDALGARRMAWATGASLTWSLAVWFRSIEATEPGVLGAARATLAGRTHYVLYDIQLPALRTLYGDNIELGVRHSSIFGFLVAAAVMALLSSRCPTDRRLRLASQALAITVVMVTFVSSSRSGLAALALTGLVFVVSRRHQLARRAQSYVLGALAISAGGTTIAGGVRSRFTEDTDSFRSRQFNASALLDGDWSVAGLPALSSSLESPHNSFIEMAAGGGLLALLAAGLIALIAAAGLAPRQSTSLPVLMLSSAVALRLTTAARGSLDTSALIAFAVVIVSLSAQSTRTNTSWRSGASASTASKQLPIASSLVRAWRRYP